MASAKETLAGTPTAAELNASKEKLQTASHKLAEAIYKANAANPSATAPTDGATAADGTHEEAKKDEGVIDAEYVDAEK